MNKIFVRNLKVVCIVGILLGTIIVPVVNTHNFHNNSISKTRNIIQVAGDGNAESVLHTNNGEWNKTFGGKRMDRGYSVQQIHDGGYIIAGDTESFSSGRLDFWLIKTDANGNEEWNKTFGGNKSERCFSCQQASDNGYILVGWKSCAKEERLADVWLIKTDEYGNEQWNKTYGDANWNGGYCVQQTQDGGYIIVGETCTSGYEGSDIWLIKTDGIGNIKWSKTFGGNKEDYGVSVQQTMDGGFIIAGNTESYIVGFRTLLIKTNKYGEEEWSKTCEGSASSVQQTNDRGYVVVGSIDKSKWWWNHHTDIWLLKVDSNGNKQWTKTFGSDRYDIGKYVEQTSDDGFIIVGETFAVRSSSEYDGDDIFDIWLIKTDTMGYEQWTKKLGGNHYEYAHEVHQTSDGGYIIVGDTWSYGSGNLDVWLIKLAEQTIQIEFSGPGLLIVIKNIGETDLSNLEWSIATSGIIFLLENKEGVIPSLPAGEEVYLYRGFVFGMGPVKITVTVGDISITANFWLLGPLIFVE